MEETKLLLFLAASVIVIVAPGPDNILVLTRGVTLGRKAALVSATGASTGLVCHSLFAAAGLSAILAIDKTRVPVRGRFRQPRLRAGGVLRVLREMGSCRPRRGGPWLRSVPPAVGDAPPRQRGGLRRLLLNALPASVFSLLMTYLAIRAMIEAGLSLL